MYVYVYVYVYVCVCVRACVRTCISARMIVCLPASSLLHHHWIVMPTVCACVRDYARVYVCRLCAYGVLIVWVCSVLLSTC